MAKLHKWTGLGSTLLSPGLALFLQSFATSTVSKRLRMLFREMKSTLNVKKMVSKMANLCSMTEDRIRKLKKFNKNLIGIKWLSHIILV
jgi:hypothetical protein